MPDQTKDIMRFSRYFNIEAPSSSVQAILLVILGAATGIISYAFIHANSGIGIFQIFTYGSSIGVILFTLPSLITVISLKAMKKVLKLKHAFFAVLAISMVYAVFFLMNSMIFAFLHNYSLAYIILILSNTMIYGYWFMINKVVMYQKRIQLFTAAFQPILNIFFFVPMNRYLFDARVQLPVVLLKLWGGMIVFMFVGYYILYLMDKPAKKELKISGVEIISSMINQWLYDITNEGSMLNRSGIKRDIEIDVMAFRNGSSFKAVFINPGIHYGPFHDVGGGIAALHLGRKIKDGLGATPFIMHGAVSFEDNPISTKQVHTLSNTLSSELKALPSSSFKPATGSFSRGSSGICNALAFKINDFTLLSLTKAPFVTEDINKGVGIELKKYASKYFGNISLVDAHNSRTESASSDELRGIYEGSKYVGIYKNAIKNAAKKMPKDAPISLGVSTRMLGSSIKNKDIGDGYSSIGIFAFGKKRFCMIYFDANNMLPNLRKEIISHVSTRFGIDSEVYTTDTHSVNTIALPASNVLGRETRSRELLPILDIMISEALSDMKPVKAAYHKITVKGFKVWGAGSEDTLKKVSREVIRNGKRKVPIIIAAGFIIAAWVIYLI